MSENKNCEMIYKQKKNCSIKDCVNSNLSHHMFKLPKNDVISKKWIFFLSTNNNEGKPPDSKIFICEQHFVHTDFSNLLQCKNGFGNRLRLKHESVPTVYCEVKEIIQQDNSEAQSEIVSNSSLVPYDKEICQAGEELDNDIVIEDFPTLKRNISDDELIDNLEDIKVEEFPLWEDKEKIFTVDNTACQQVNSVQIKSFSSDSTHKVLENFNELKQPTSQNVSSGLDIDANKNKENEVKYEESKSINSKIDKGKTHRILGITTKNVGVLENPSEICEIVGNTLDDSEVHRNILENNVASIYKVLGNTLEYICSDNPQISFMEKDEPINEESSMYILDDDDSTSKISKNILKLKSKTWNIKAKNKHWQQEGYKDMILMAISSLQNSVCVSSKAIYKYIYENFDHGNKTEEDISQYLRKGIMDLLSTGFIVKSRNRFDTNLEAFFDIKRKYKDIILEAIASSTDPSCSDLTYICNYMHRKKIPSALSFIRKISSALPFIRRCVEKLISTGEVIKIGNILKLPDKSVERDKESLKSKTINLKQNLDSENPENIIEKENLKSKKKKIKHKLDKEKTKNIIEIKETSKYRNKNPKLKLDYNIAGAEDVDYKEKYIDLILSKEMEYNKKIKDKIFNENNYVDCTYRDCDLILYSEHIEKHLQDHKSSKVMNYINTVDNIRKFICTECGQKYISFGSIANHLLTHSKDKVANERVCTECGYKNKRLTAFKSHRCNNLKVTIENSSKVSRNKDHLDANLKKTNKKVVNDKRDEEYIPSVDSDYHSSDDDMEDIDEEIQMLKSDHCDIISKLKVSCTRCHEEFENETVCKNHLKKDHNFNIKKRSVKFIRKEVNKKLGIRNFWCLECNKIYHNIDSCRTHIYVNHPDIKYHCDQCDFVACRRYIIDHIKNNHKYQNSICKICNKFYKNKGKLRDHMRFVHTSKPDKKFLCHTCGKVFKNRDKLDIHLLIHTGEKPFACKLCKFSTVQKYNLVVHMRSHERGTIKTLKK